ncbi:serine/threonine-protein kinase [Nocardiopsis coralli]|uniref:serine/threonine-protein kinase n=1 Tax=Nocardiopsis coralli TaxID=2772213 RepID=UPI002E299A06|nr:serine/threonine-protein kinase [Nocardiopsis coralli]
MPYPPTADRLPKRPGDPERIGRYRIAGRLGEGGMGTVHAGVDPRGSPVAVKVVHRDFAADPEFRARFAREVGMVQRARSPYVPAFLSADTDADRPWLATEFVPGLPLHRHIAEHGPLQGGALWGLAAGTAEALQSIHALGIVHRDLKPGNVILAPDGPKLLDFGIARAVDESAITRTGGLLGTPGWVAPEVFRGAQPGAAGDVFAWAELLLYAATGEAPFGDGPPDVVALRLMEEQPDTEGVPEALRPVVTAALAKDPEARPTAEQALRAVVGEHTGRSVGSTAEATQVVPTLLDREWQRPDATADAPGWPAAMQARQRRSRRRTGALFTVGAAAMALVVTWAAGAWTGPGQDGTGTAGDGAEAGDAEEAGAADPPEDAAAAGREIVELSVHSGGSDLFTVYASEDGALGVDPEPGDSLDWSPLPLDPEEHSELAEATITFLDAEEGDGGVEFTAEAVFLADAGTYTIRAGDFTLFERTTDEQVHPEPGDPDESHPSFDEYTAQNDEELAVLSPENREQEFTFTVADAPPSGYLIYIPDPGQVWGPDYADAQLGPGTLCYSADVDGWQPGSRTVDPWC